MKWLGHYLACCLLVEMSQVLGSSAEQKKRVLIWMNNWDVNDTQLTQHVEWFANLPFVVTVSPTTHLLGPNATLEVKPRGKSTNTTPVQLYQELRRHGLRVLPILYNDETGNGAHTLLPKLRQLFANPDGFIRSAVELCVENDLDGWNLDFEGFDSPTAQDGVELVAFLDKLGAALHVHGKVLSMDYEVGAYYTSIWPEAALNHSTGLDILSNMGSYTNNLTDFVTSTQSMVDKFALKKIGVGLCQVCWPVGSFNAEALDARFDLIDKLGVQEIDIWVDKFSDGSDGQVSWVPYLSKWVHGPVVMSPQILHV